MEKNVEKQLIVRTFEPDMTVLKNTAKQLAGMQDVALNLYGQAGEVLIVITARAHAPAAAIELTETVAEQFETALGEAAYGRGKGSLAYFVAGELQETEAALVGADADTGALLGEEFSHTKRGSSVFDFGQASYEDAAAANKIETLAQKNYEAGNAAQKAAAYAVAAAKCARVEYGVSIVNDAAVGSVYVAVAYKGHVYMRRFAQAQDVGKHAALAALDIIRLLACKLPVEKARVFKANTDFDWNDPVQKKPHNPYVAPIAVLAVLLVALGVACWYFFTNFALGDTTGNALPVSGQNSVQTTVSDASSSDDAQQPDSAVEDSTSAQEGGAQEEQDTSTSDSTAGPVRPFG